MPIPPTPPRPFAPLFELERGRLLDLLRALDTEAWERPNKKPGMKSGGSDVRERPVFDYAKPTTDRFRRVVVRTIIWLSVAVVTLLAPPSK